MKIKSDLASVEESKDSVRVVSIRESDHYI